MSYVNLTRNAVLLMITLGMGMQVIALDPQFSLHNKSTKNIKVELRNAGQIIFDSPVSPASFLDGKIDISAPTFVTIKDPQNNEVYRASFTKGKTIYVNWDDNHTPKLYYQRGPWLGTTGKTDKGYSTSNNVADSDITSLRLTLAPPPAKAFSLADDFRKKLEQFFIDKRTPELKSFIVLLLTIEGKPHYAFLFDSEASAKKFTSHLYYPFRILDGVSEKKVQKIPEDQQRFAVILTPKNLEVLETKIKEGVK